MRRVRRPGLGCDSPALCPALYARSLRVTPVQHGSYTQAIQTATRLLALVPMPSNNNTMHWVAFKRDWIGADWIGADSFDRFPIKQTEAELNVLLVQLIHSVPGYGESSGDEFLYTAELSPDGQFNIDALGPRQLSSGDKVRCPLRSVWTLQRTHASSSTSCPASGERL